MLLHELAHIELQQRHAERAGKLAGSFSLADAGRTSEQEAASEHSQHTLGEALASGRVWLLGLIYLCMVIGMYGIGLWLPQMLRALTAADDFTLGLLNALPFLAATVGMVLIGRHSDSRNERPLHVAGSLALAATGTLLAALSYSLPMALLAFSLAAVGVWAVMGPFWALATSFLSGAAAAGGIALINSLGNVGGFLGPYLMGWLKQMTDGYSAGLSTVAAILVAGSSLMLITRSWFATRLSTAAPGLAQGQVTAGVEP